MKRKEVNKKQENEMNKKRKEVNKKQENEMNQKNKMNKKRKEVNQKNKMNKKRKEVNQKQENEMVEKQENEMVEKEENEIVEKIFLYKNFFTKNQSDYYQSELYDNIEWKQEIIKMMGRTIIAPRLINANGDEGLKYKYAGKQEESKGWNDIVLKIKQKVEKHTNETYNYGLLNLYRDGNDYIGYHSDDEKDLDSENSIASISFGSEREFRLKRKQDGKVFKVILPHGSLLIMKSGAQKMYKHCIPKKKGITEKRINLTLRKVLTR